MRKLCPYCITLHEKDTYLSMTCEISIQVHELLVIILSFSRNIGNSIISLQNYVVFVWSFLEKRIPTALETI